MRAALAKLPEPTKSKPNGRSRKSNFSRFRVQQLEHLELRRLLSATITVNGVGDDDSPNGMLTLREAIRLSNGTKAFSSLSPEEKQLVQGAPGENTLDTIKFNLPVDGTRTIVVGEGGLPSIFEPLIIDGTTQPGFNASTHVPVVAIDASAAGDFHSGLDIVGGGSVVKGLAIHGAPGSGILLRLRGGNTIMGNFIGTDLTGTVTESYGNRGAGIHILDSPDNQIGDANPGEGNLISGNLGGVVISNGASTGNRVYNNFIGTDVTGTKSLGNRFHGVLVTAQPGRTDYASGTSIGGALANQGNVISGNKENGVAIVRGAGNKVLGNWIGTNSDGSDQLGNSRDGVWVIDAPDTRIGGEEVHARNVISSNLRHGIQISGSGAVGTLVQGNLIGTDGTGLQNFGTDGTDLQNFGNLRHGIFVGEYVEDSDSAPVLPPVVGAPSRTIIGGTTTAARNVISDNDRDGIHIEGRASSTFVLGNFIGTDINGTQPLGNAINGVTILNSTDSIVGGMKDSSDNLIQSGNLISANKEKGVHVDGLFALHNLVLANIIGLNLTGTEAMGNGAGVFVGIGASSNTIGRTTFAERNVISGNALGVAVFGNSNVIQGNYIGTDVGGDRAIGNKIGGVIVAGDFNTIGGEQEDAFNLRGGNLISGNIGNGIQIQSTASDNTVKGNFIGTDRSGQERVSNTQNGILIDNAQRNTIGGETLTPGFSPGNLIAGNGDDGIYIKGADAQNNRVQGNVIGLNNFGELTSNSGSGVRIEQGSGNTIGGIPTSGKTVGNVISGNLHGVVVLNGGNNKISGNLIGTDKTGAMRMGNIEAGVTLQDSSGNVVGGESQEERNIISGNLGFGVAIIRPLSTGNTVKGNFIGTDLAGAAPVPNSKDGVTIALGAEKNVIGGRLPQRANVISGNLGDGVSILGPGGFNDLLGNSIGVGVDGVTNVGNAEHGVVIDDSNDNDIGGGT